MYSDLLDVLGNQNSTSLTRSGSDSGKHIAVSFKAGKMKMELQENGKYWVTPDIRRGQVQLVWTPSNNNGGELKWEWMDRRDKTIVDSIKVEQGGTFERIKDDERIYLWTTPTSSSNSNKWQMYWMQDLDQDGEDELLVQVNQYLMNPSEAAPEGVTANIIEQLVGSTSGGTTTSNAGTNSNNAQVDALSNILENLGMPENGAESPAGPMTGTLTLADLQGAMAGLQTASPINNTTTPLPLSEVVTPAVVTSILQDDDAKNRLLEFLPEEQRSLEHLEDNLRSPQIQQTLNALSSALMPDQTGSMEGYHSIIANFQLDPEVGAAALAAGNPIQAFLDCILASVEKEKEQEQNADETKDESMEE